VTHNPFVVIRALLDKGTLDRRLFIPSGLLFEGFIFGQFFGILP